MVSVIVPARNEAENILACLQSILLQNYPPELFEIIVIDDHSTDGTGELVKAIASPQIKLLHLADHLENNASLAFKKMGLQLGIQHAKGELLVTTDADCIAQKNWLRFIVSFYEIQQPKFIAAPVNFHQEQSLLERFQSLDFMGLMLITGAGIQSSVFHMSNGANLAYPREVFERVNGYEGIDHLASGDDLLLMHKIAARYPGRIGFLKNFNATVLTQAKPTWKGFLSQRLRWATKSSSYQEKQLTFILAMVFLFCLSIVFSLLATLILGWTALLYFGALFLLKTIADYFFLKRAARFFNRKDLMSSFFLAQWLHILYIVIIGILGNLVKKYEWKGRKVR